MRRTTITAFAVMLLAALALVAAGCGGSSKNSAATTEATTTEAATTAEATTEAATTEAATTEATNTTAITGALAGKCKGLNDLNTFGQKLATALSGTGGNTVDIKKEAQLLQEFAAKAPSEIKADFQTMADFVSKIAEQLPKYTPGQTPDAATIAKLQKLGQSLQADAPKTQAASQHIVAWVTKNCK